MPAGRPKKYIDKNIFENLCKQFNTLEDIAAIFDCSEDTIERWCKREYKKNFADIYKKYSAYGRRSLRQAQFKSALMNENVSMQIFLGKNYLGQSDRIENKVDLTEIPPDVQAEVESIISESSSGDSDTDDNKETSG